MTRQYHDTLGSVESKDGKMKSEVENHWTAGKIVLQEMSDQEYTEEFMSGGMDDKEDY